MITDGTQRIVHQVNFLIKNKNRLIIDADTPYGRQTLNFRHPSELYGKESCRINH